MDKRELSYISPNAKIGKNVDGADYIRGLQSIEGVIGVENAKY